MTSLRQSCVTAMAEKLRDDKYTEWTGRKTIHEIVAENLLDALLTTLTDHATEWATETSNRYMTTAAFQADTDEEAHIHNLLAVLRGSGE